MELRSLTPVSSKQERASSDYVCTDSQSKSDNPASRNKDLFVRHCTKAEAAEKAHVRRNFMVSFLLIVTVFSNEQADSSVSLPECICGSFFCSSIDHRRWRCGGGGRRYLFERALFCPLLGPSPFPSSSSLWSPPLSISTRLITGDLRGRRSK